MCAYTTLKMRELKQFQVMTMIFCEEDERECFEYIFMQIKFPS